MARDITHKELCSLLYTSAQKGWTFIHHDEEWVWERAKKCFYRWGYDSYNEIWDDFYECISDYEAIVLDGCNILLFRTLAYYDKYKELNNDHLADVYKVVAGVNIENNKNN